MMRVENLSVSFGGVRAVDGVHLAVNAHEVVGLVGPNGSGKSTTLNAICGFVRAEGRVSLGGADVPLGDPLPPRTMGILRTFQTPQVFDDLTCLENVLLGCSDRRTVGIASSILRWRTANRFERDRWLAAMASLERVGLAARSMAKAGGLAYGDRRRVELARALVAEPRIILLDEPSAGLNDWETSAFADLLEEICVSLPLLIVDHKVDLLDRVCDRIIVVNQGRVIAHGPPDFVWNEPTVVDAYLGRSDAAL